MYFDYLIVLAFAAVGLLFVFANLVAASLIRPRRAGEVGLETYECGEETVGTAWVQFDVRYYTVALVYIVFAVEIAFLFPWALVLRDCFNDAGAAQSRGIGAFALFEGLLFGAILFLGLVYVWKKGDLDWVMGFHRAQPQSSRAAKPVVMLGHNLQPRRDAEAVVPPRRDAEAVVREG